MNALLSTLVHALELAVSFGVAYGVMRLFHTDSETNVVLLTLVVNALGKFARTSKSIPIPDYVNGNGE